MKVSSANNLLKACGFAGGYGTLTIIGVVAFHALGPYSLMADGFAGIVLTAGAVKTAYPQKSPVLSAHEVGKRQKERILADPLYEDAYRDLLANRVNDIYADEQW